MEVTLRLLVAALCAASLAALADARGHSGCTTAGWGARGNYSYLLKPVEVDFSHSKTVLVRLPDDPVPNSDLVGLDVAFCGAQFIYFSGDFTLVIKADENLRGQKGMLIAVGHYVPVDSHTTKSKSVVYY